MVRITEGNAILEASLRKVPTKRQTVFYNPAMREHRDLTLLLLAAHGGNLQCCDALAGSGVRAIRLLQEHPDIVEHITINDRNQDAVARIRENLERNGIGFESWDRERLFAHSLKTEGPGTRKAKNFLGRRKAVLPRVIVTNLDASTLLLGSNGYDYIELDPFGSPNAHLDAACKRIARGGILALTFTDTAPLAGVYPKTCKRKYWAVPCTGVRKHEVGLRIAVRKTQLVGAQYEKALTPVLVYRKQHYYRAFFRCEKSKVKADALLRLHGRWDQEPEAGPLWLGPMVDGVLVKKMLKNAGEHTNFLKILKEENNYSTIPYYYLIDEVGGKKEELLRREGVARTHHDPNAVRSAHAMSHM